MYKSLRRDGYSSQKVVWAPSKTGKERVVPLTPQVIETLLEHQGQMQEQGLYEKQGLVFLSPEAFTNVYDHLLGRVWHRSLTRCGLPPRRCMPSAKVSCPMHWRWVTHQPTSPRLLATPQRYCLRPMPNQLDG